MTLLVWYNKASCLCYTTSTGTLLDSSQISSHCPVSWRFYSSGSVELQQFICRVDVGVGQVKALDLGMRCDLIILPALPAA